jgi:serine/threonine-protein kinase
MASVHLARMDGPGGFQKWVAIKRIHPHLSADECFIQMFLDEARIAARISHPNVATVFELGRQGNTYWIAMEYLHGEPLREIMRRIGDLGGPMPPEIAARIIADAAEGLHSAHELLGRNGEKLNLIHRDVTPHNLFVTYDGATKVVDFGIAKWNSGMSNTRAGTLKGKLAYMSPEQVHGGAIDRRTDIFALGVVIWELTTGQRLFRVDSDLGTLAKVRECEIPRPSTIVRAYPIDLENIVMKALSKNREDRFATAREFSRALQRLLMRRGLFVASDEVAGYVRFIFRDRIRKREEHLRWAGNLAPRSLASSSTPSLHTYVSDMQAAALGPRALPRPAAGIPPSPYSTSAPTVVRNSGAGHRTATAHAESVRFGDDLVDDADTLVTRRASEERLLAQPAPLRRPWNEPRHAGHGRGVPSFGPVQPVPVQPVERRKPGNAKPRTSKPKRMPVWAAAAISGAMALPPACGIFVALSRALRSSAKVAAGQPLSNPSTAPRVPVTVSRSRPSASSVRAKIPSPPAPFQSTSSAEGGIAGDLGSCGVSVCAP